MKIYTRTLDITKFKKDFSSLQNIRGREDKESILNDVVARIEAVKSNIVDFLKDVDNIEDEKVQECCRRAAIAQMYKANLDYRLGYPYIPDYQHSKHVLLIRHQTRYLQDSSWRIVNSIAFVSKYGETIIHEGSIKDFDSNHGGWVVENLQTRKNGFISDYGDMLIPFIFDNPKVLDHGLNPTFFFYKGILFELYVYAQQDRLEKKWFKQLLNLSKDPDFIICRSEKGVLYELKADDSLYDSNGEIVYNLKRSDGKCGSEADPMVFQEALKEVKDLMTPYTISTDELKKLLNS